MTRPRILCPLAPAETNDHPVIMDMLRCYGHATFTGLTSQDDSGAQDYLEGFKGFHRHVPPPTGSSAHPPLPPAATTPPEAPPLENQPEPSRCGCQAVGSRRMGRDDQFPLARRTLTATLPESQRAADVLAGSFSLHFWQLSLFSGSRLASRRLE